MKIQDIVITPNGCPEYTSDGVETLKEHWKLVKQNLKSLPAKAHEFQIGFRRDEMRHYNDPNVVALGYSFNEIDDVCFMSIILIIFDEIFIFFNEIFIILLCFCLCFVFI